MADYSEANIYNSVESPAGRWFKLKDGEQALVRITSNTKEALIYQSEFTDKKSGEISYSNRFAYVIWNHTAKKAQIWSGIAGATYDQIKRYITNPEYGDVTQYDITVEREGEGLQTRYTVTAGRKNYELKPNQLTACEEIDLLTEIGKDKKASHIVTLEHFHLMNKEGGDEFVKQHHAAMMNTDEDGEPLPIPPGDESGDSE